MVVYPEELLKRLDDKWSTVKLQNNWTLEPVFRFDEGLTQEAQADILTDSSSTTLLQPRGQEQIESDAAGPDSNTSSHSPPGDDNISNSVFSQD